MRTLITIETATGYASKVIKTKNEAEANEAIKKLKAQGLKIADVEKLDK